MIRFACGNCTERLGVPEKFAGQKALCPTCGMPNRVPLRGMAGVRPVNPSSAATAAPAQISPADAIPSLSTRPTEAWTGSEVVSEVPSRRFSRWKPIPSEAGQDVLTLDRPATSSTLRYALLVLGVLIAVFVGWFILYSAIGMLTAGP